MRPDPADVLVARAADRIALVAMRGDAAGALELVRELHEHRADVQICLRYDTGTAAAPAARQATATPAKYPGRCTVCATSIAVGDPIRFDPASRKPVHARCA